MDKLTSFSDDLPRGTGVLAGILLGAALRDLILPLVQRLARPPSPAPSAPSEPHKLVLCVRADLGMSKGKTGAQCGHATLAAYKACAARAPGALAAWEAAAQPKIALHIGSAREAAALAAAARTKGLVVETVFDAGRTQIAAGSLTVVAIGPGPVGAVNSVTGHLKLL